MIQSALYRGLKDPSSKTVENFYSRGIHKMKVLGIEVNPLV